MTPSDVGSSRRPTKIRVAIPRARTARGPVVNVWMSISLVGAMLRYLSLTLVVPLAFAIQYDESVRPYVLSLVIGFLAGTMMQRLTPDHRELGIREGFLVVTLTWLVAAAMGALPYIFSSEPQVDGIVDAYFESMSGFTTTGASVLTDIEALPRSLLIWRSLTQWLGGIGFVVLALAVLPKLAVGGSS